MGKLILGLVAAFVVIMVALTVIHIFFYAFVFALIALLAVAVFKVGRWSGGHRSREY
jgi:hypothetical protein